MKVSEKKIPCQVWSRVTGYLRPVESWNIAKREEFKDRVNYKVNRKHEPRMRRVNDESERID